jgi:hypothetical protein
MRILLLSALIFVNGYVTFSQKVSFAHRKYNPKKEIMYKDGHEVIEAMYKAYEGGKWYRNFSFTQKTVFFDKDGKEEKSEFWHEASSAPGKLLIKTGSKDSKNGVLVENGKIHVYREGKEPVHRTGLHDLSLAAFDVYYQAPSLSNHLFDSLGYNMQLVRRDEFDGRKVFVIGAAKGDTTSRQLWVDAERFYLHRIIYLQGKAVMDAVFTDYEQMKPADGNYTYWVATKMVFKRNGLPDVTEKYFDIKFPKEFPPDTFDPEKFNSVKLD